MRRVVLLITLALVAALLVAPAGEARTRTVKLPIPHPGNITVAVVKLKAPRAGAARGARLARQLVIRHPSRLPKTLTIIGGGGKVGGRFVAFIEVLNRRTTTRSATAGAAQTGTDKVELGTLLDVTAKLIADDAITKADSGSDYICRALNHPGFVNTAPLFGPPIFGLKPVRVAKEGCHEADDKPDPNQIEVRGAIGSKGANSRGDNFVPKLSHTGDPNVVRFHVDNRQPRGSIAAVTGFLLLVSSVNIVDGTDPAGFDCQVRLVAGLTAYVCTGLWAPLTPIDVILRMDRVVADNVGGLMLVAAARGLFQSDYKVTGPITG
jgi:hypothetical protein